MKSRRARLYASRIEAAMEALSIILRERVADRRRAAKIVEEVYRKHALQPIRGKAWPPDIWDKELATLYVVGKYALALHEESPETFHSVFSVEEVLEEAAQTILDEARSAEERAKIASFLLGGTTDSNVVARMFRVITTASLLGFRPEEDVERLLKLTAELLPDHAQTARKYARYYIALKTAEAIALGVVRDRISKEAFKQALAARIGLERVIPDDEYVAFIAKTLYSVPQSRLRRILSLGRRAGSEEG